MFHSNIGREAKTAFIAHVESNANTVLNRLVVLNVSRIVSALPTS
jgi:hypothetical protein